MLLSVPASAFEAFVVEEIKVNGLQRLPARVVYNALQVNVGERVTPSRAARSIESLFRTGNFDDIQLVRSGETLVVIWRSVRPSVRLSLKATRILKVSSYWKG